MTTAAPRPQAVAGAFYPGRPAALDASVRAAFSDPRGIRGPMPPRGTGPRRTRALVVPHAGYVYSGPVAARAYARVAREPLPPEILLLGVDHHGLGAPFALSGRAWRTPLGEVPEARDLRDALRGGPIVVDEAAHAQEHSLEVQLPFLQLVAPGAPVAMLTVRFDRRERLRAVGARVREVIHGRPTLLIASTDFSHYVTASEARRLDTLAIGEIRRRDADGLYTTVTEREISMCGIAPTTVLLDALEGEALEVEDLGWSHSGEAEPMDRVVGYGALALVAPAPRGGGSPVI